MKTVFFLVVLISAFAFTCVKTRAQEWKRIQPLITRCGDLKRMFGTTSCTYPVSNFDSECFSVNVTFAGGRRAKNPFVARAVVLFKKWVPLADVEANLDGYEVKPDGDMEDSKIYTNYEKGISLTVRKVLEEKEGFVSSAVLFQKRKK